MIDFEKICREAVAELNAKLPPESQRTGTQKLVATQNAQIAAVCCKILKKYHATLNNQKSAEQAVR